MRRFGSPGALALLVLMLAIAVLVPRQAGALPNLLVDASTGQVFFAEEADRPWHPASTTKLMTAYIAFEDIRAGKLALTDAVIQSERSIAEPPSKIGLPVGLGMTLDIALQALIVKSANDVAVMIAEKIGGNVETFVLRMNATAQRLGMTNTRFVNPNGLHDAGQVTTARDLARLAMALMRDFPEQNERFRHYYMNIGKRHLHSYNSLLKKYEGADGMKTGFVCASGYNVVASATRNGHRLIAVVLGARNGEDRTDRATTMFDYGFEFYDWKMRLAAAGSGAKLDTQLAGAESAEPPADMRGVVCGGRGVAARAASNREARKSARKKRKGHKAAR